MNNDLISRDALKEDLKQYFSDGTLDSVSAKLAFNMILRKIDNAPTVDIKDEIAGAYNEGYMCGSREAEKARPQGEWIHYLGCGIGKAVCSECGQVGETKKYCGNCGADMRKGGADMRNITETPSSCTTTNPNSVEAYHQSLKGGAE